MNDQQIELLVGHYARARNTPNEIALREVQSGREMSRGQLHRAKTDFAFALAREVPAGSVVMLRCPNTVNFHVAFLGALLGRYNVFPVPHDIAEAEFKQAAEKASAAAVIESDLTIRRLGGDFLQEGPALLLQSSGTTGLPKIVRRDGWSLDAVSASMVRAIGMSASDHVLACVPLCHSYGLEHGLLAPLWAGATVHLAQGFDLPTIQRELSQSGITIFPAVPSIFEMLGASSEPLASKTLRLAYSAGAPLPAGVFAKARQTLNVPIGQLYGATEIGSVTFAHPAKPHFDPASVGQPMDGVEIRIDPDEQLLVRARSMMSSYLHDESPLTADGFFPTGDLARTDAHGNLFITGRLKLLIDVGGLKVNPLEVEATIAQHPAVAACVVVPLKQSETVFRLKAIVQPTDSNHPPAGEELRCFVRERLSAHKVPRVFELRDSLPRSATGKILRHLLIESA